jgi:hypothetical protein
MILTSRFGDKSFVFHFYCKAGSNLLGKDNMGQTAFSLGMTSLDEDDYNSNEKLAVQNLLNRMKGLVFNSYF